MLVKIKHLKELFETRKIEIVHKDLYVSNLSSMFEGVKIVQISDLHINEWSIALVEEVIYKINLLNPDIAFITGDVICSGKRHLPDLVHFFKKINATLGKYACLGNHDYSDGESSKRVERMYTDSDFRLLVNDTDIISHHGSELVIAGIDDYDFGSQDIEKIKNNICENQPKILLAHNPINFNEFSHNSFDTVISGHTHGGQIYLPFMSLFYEILLGAKYISGMYEMDDACMYVNRGIGTAMVSSVIMDKKIYFNTPRLNSNPEITVFTLRSNKKN